MSAIGEGQELMLPRGSWLNWALFVCRPQQRIMPPSESWCSTKSSYNLKWGRVWRSPAYFFVVAALTLIFLAITTTGSCARVGVGYRVEHRDPDGNGLAWHDEA